MGVETVLIGAAIGAGIGAIGGAVGGGGDKIWQGALTGAVGGAVTGGVGSWAGSAAGLGWGGMAAGALGGAAGGITAGALGTALSGGTGSDYLRNIGFGGLGGAALGAAGGYLQGGETAGVNPVTGEPIPTGSPEITALPDAEGATGMQTGTTAAPAIETSVTGSTTPTTQVPTSTPLADTISSVSQNIAPLETTSAAPTSLANLGQQGQAQAATSMQNLGLSPTAEGVTMPVNAETSMAPATQAMNESPTSFWDKFLGGAKSTTGTGKMGLEDYLKMQGKAQLVGGGMKALGAIATAPETQQNRQQLMDLYNQQNAANQFYQNQLQNTYTNPQGYLGSPEAAATRSAALQKALAMNAAAGRRTQGGALANQLMQAQLTNLQNYRAGMPRPNYGTAAQNLQLAQQYSPTADIFGGLSSMVTPTSLYSLFG